MVLRFLCSSVPIPSIFAVTNLRVGKKERLSRVRFSVLFGATLSFILSLVVLLFLALLPKVLEEEAAEAASEVV